MDTLSFPVDIHFQPAAVGEGKVMEEGGVAAGHRQTGDAEFPSGMETILHSVYQ